MGRFRNLDPFDERGFGDVVKWQLGARRPDRNEPFLTPTVPNDGAIFRAPEASVTWIGHSSFALRLGGLAVLTDPVFASRLGVTRRHCPVGLEVASMPPIDVVCVSHAHHDHLDLPSLRAVNAHTLALTGKPTLFMVPTEVGRRYLRGLSYVERGWWEHHDVTPVARPGGKVRFTLVPQQHWSMRGPFDRNEALWGGWVIQAPEGTAYHAGDTAYFGHFAEIGRRAGPVDWAMLPIGAYDPVWFMKPQHMGPEEAGRSFMELRAKNLLCMHWGTYKLTDEPLAEPLLRIDKWWDDEGPGPSDRDRLWRFDVGETRRLR